MAENLNIIKWDKIQYQIETAKDIDVLLGLKDRLRAYQVLAEQSRQSSEVQAKIAIYKARADRKCGEWLKENVKVGGDHGNQYHKVAKSNDATLANLGVTKKVGAKKYLA
jgi:type IV pilus biogenesis protein CpaD/CtpE